MSISASTPFGYDLSQILSTVSLPPRLVLVSYGMRPMLVPSRHFRRFRERGPSRLRTVHRRGRLSSTAARREGQGGDDARRGHRGSGSRSVVQRTAAEGRTASAKDSAGVAQT